MEKSSNIRFKMMKRYVRNDENEKEQYETAYKECLVLTNALQIAYMCFFILLKKTKFLLKNFILLKKANFWTIKLSDMSLSESLIVRNFSVLM